MSEFIATIPNTEAGRIAVNHLREFGGEFQCRYIISLADFLRREGPAEAISRAPELLDDFPYTFHLLSIETQQEELAVVKLLRWHSDPTGRRRLRGHIQALEPNVRARLSCKGIAFTPGDRYYDYLKRMNVSDPPKNDRPKNPVTVAVLDTGSAALDFVSDFFDLTSSSDYLRPGKKNQKDKEGHGTVMATLIHQVAPDAKIKIVRITESAPECLHVLAGLAVAVADCHAEIINLSFGFRDFGLTCCSCGAGPVARSIAMGKLLTMLTEIDRKRLSAYVAPIFVAATGNDYKDTFDYPAAFDQTIAVGSVNSRDTRSACSNYGTPHPAYVLAPGRGMTPGAMRRM